MPGSFETVIRADDLLYCQFELVNLALGMSSTGAPQLTRVAAGPAHIILRLPPQNVAEQNVLAGVTPSLPYQGGLSCPSRLTFRIPDNVTAIDYRLTALLALLASADLETADNLTNLATAIECPDRVLLVPQPASHLVHRADAFTSPDAGVTELWHTTFGDIAAGGAARLRAIANPNDRADRPFPTALKKADRDAIVRHSLQSPDPNVIASSVLRLTTLGATMRLKSDWPSDPNISLAAWEHDVELGRDRYVRVVEQGYLFPFGHRAAIARVTQRQLASHPPVQTAELVQTNFLSILEPERSYENLAAAYPSAGREMPLVRARVASAPQQINDVTAPIPIDLVMTDRAGNQFDCSASAFFVPAGAAADQTSLVSLKNRYGPMSVVPFNGQRIALAENDVARGDTGLNVDSMTFDVKLPSELVGQAIPAFLPCMLTAEARIPAIEQMVGTVDPAPAAHRQAARVAFHDAYLRSGFHGDAKDVFVKFAPIASLAIPADRAGGLAAPKFPGIDGLSRLTGPVAGVEDFVNSRPLDPGTLIGDSKLLGVIPLKEVIAAVAAGADPFPVEAVRDLFDRVEDATIYLPRPVMTTVAAASGVETRFIWKPHIADNLPSPLAKPASGTMGLILKGRITADGRSPSGPPAFAVQGKLSNFALSLLDLVTVRFDAVEFASQSGSKLDVKIRVAGVDFLGSLAFVQKLQELLPTKSMTGLPPVQTLPDGVTVRYAIPIPSVPFGVMNIENLMLSSSVSLPFVEGKPAAVRFALSQRDNPFQINISIFGGTGFFSLEALTDKSLTVEAALEFGGIAELDLVVVKGGIHLLVGVYLSMASNGTLVIEGHLRLGGYVDVLGLVSVSIEFYLALTYDGGRHTLAGTGRLTVGVKLLFYSDSFTFEVHREIPAFGAAPSVASAPTGPVHAAHLPLATAARVSAARDAIRAPAMSATQWESYCRAFA